MKLKLRIIATFSAIGMTACYGTVDRIRAEPTANFPRPWPARSQDIKLGRSDEAPQQPATDAAAPTAPRAVAGPPATVLPSSPAAANPATPTRKE